MIFRFVATHMDFNLNTDRIKTCSVFGYAWLFFKRIRQRSQLYGHGPHLRSSVAIAIPGFRIPCLRDPGHFRQSRISGLAASQSRDHGITKLVKVVLFSRVKW